MEIYSIVLLFFQEKRVAPSPTLNKRLSRSIYKFLFLVEFRGLVSFLAILFE